MTEITRVPIQPIAKGSLTKLWLGVLLAVLAGAGLAWAAVPAGVKVETLTAGSGPFPQDGEMVFVTYTGKLEDGTVFDESQEPPIPPGLFPKGNPFPVDPEATIPGFAEALKQVQRGGRYVFHIPADKAYGDAPPPGANIPAGSDLIFEVEVSEFMGREDFERRLAALQQMMQQQQEQMQQQGGGAGAPPAIPSPHSDAPPQ